MQVDEIKKILENYDDNSCTSEQKLQLELWFLSMIVDSDWDLAGPELELSRIRVLENLNSKIDKEKTSILKIAYWRYIVSAAAVIAVIGFAVLFSNNHDNNSGIDLSKSAQLVKPGRNMAKLTLANGKEISLSDAENGNLANESGSIIKKYADGKLVYTPSDKNPVKTTTEYNAVSTPKAGQYQIWLPDGTKVYLNAASFLRYPSSFTGLKYRMVELTGEGYFEVKKDARIPFIVLSKGQKVEVLGTHFNINSYSDEATTKTTLLEGSVRINENVTIKPGEQASGKNNKFTVTLVDAEAAIDWKNGDFIFNKGEDLQSAMRKIARWYDVQVIYDRDVATEMEPRGWVSRKNNLSVVLAAIEQSTKNIHFKVEGRRVFVTK